MERAAVERAAVARADSARADVERAAVERAAVERAAVARADSARADVARALAARAAVARADSLGATGENAGFPPTLSTRSSVISFPVASLIFAFCSFVSLILTSFAMMFSFSTRPRCNAAATMPSKAGRVV